MKGKNRYSLIFLVGVIASFVTVVTVAVSLILVFDRRKKREEQELEDYLESGIN